MVKGGDSEKTLYMYAPSLFLDLYIGSSLLANHYVKYAVSLASLVNDRNFKVILASKLLDNGDRGYVDDVINNLRYVSLISVINPGYVAKLALRLTSTIKDYERTHDSEMVKWYSRVTGSRELPYSKMIYSLKHTVKITRDMVKHYLYSKAPGMLRKSIVDSLMQYISILPDALVDYLKMTSKSDAMAIIFLTHLINAYGVDYPLRLMFNVMKRLIVKNPELLKLVLSRILNNLSSRSSYYKAVLAELTRIYIYSNDSLDDESIIYTSLNSMMNNDSVLMRHGVDLIKTLGPLMYEYIYRLSILSLNNDPRSLDELSAMLGGVGRGLVDLILREWDELNNEYSLT